ncbi:hypothetical protein [Indioceanicola profundi]|uniref:hypothetical protein n=1 Tax=Indioceanicola profundi TaxID=2220096 RepID=UPI0013C40574|nr:hypothetical protein [Indioceanicola profundi]
MRDWKELDEIEQLELRAAYDRELADQPPTCLIEEKIMRFRAWLVSRGIDYPA